MVQPFTVPLTSCQGRQRGVHIQGGNVVMGNRPAAGGAGCNSSHPWMQLLTHVPLGIEICLG